MARPPVTGPRSGEDWMKFVVAYVQSCAPVAGFSA
jgi:hypothetical protein